MSVEFEIENNDIAVFRISGEFKLIEFQDAQRKCEELIKKVGKIKILVITDKFGGWEKTEEWGDWSFADRNDSYIDKIAIVGDEKWRDLIFAFTGKGFRPVDIEYFDEGQETSARRWLDAH
ncbi:MAG: STAS/SEC14 domain-containing protein [Gammaproteobacteria bacterium]